MVLKDGNLIIDMADVNFQMRTSNFKTVIRNMQDKTSKTATKILDERAERTRKLISEKSPKRTGKYASEWIINKDGQKKRIISNKNPKLSHILEFTGKAEVKVTGDPLHFVIDGQDVFATFANTGSFKPIPHIRPAIKQVKQESRAAIIRIWKEEMPQFK